MKCLGIPCIHHLFIIYELLVIDGGPDKSHCMCVFEVTMYNYEALHQKVHRPFQALYLH
jgi:hypothetical protein